MYDNQTCSHVTLERRSTCCGQLSLPDYPNRCGACGGTCGFEHYCTDCGECIADMTALFQALTTAFALGIVSQNWPAQVDALSAERRVMPTITDADRLYARVAEQYPNEGLLDICKHPGPGFVNETITHGSGPTAGMSIYSRSATSNDCLFCHGVGTMLPPPEVRLGRLVRLAKGVTLVEDDKDGHWWAATKASLGYYSHGPDPEPALCQSLITAKEGA